MGATFEAIVTFENLHAAAWQVFRGKRGKSHANALCFALEDRLLELERELRSGAYRPGEYHTFWIRDPKPRLISAAPLRDRVVHHAVVRVLEPRFERRFIHDSYACRTGKGQHRALERFVGWARSSRYALMLDVHRFFPSIDHEVLKAEVRRGLRDEGALELLDRIIDSSNLRVPAGQSPASRLRSARPRCALSLANPQEPVLRWFPGDDLLTPLERRRGLPIGNLTSQFLANVLLDRVDHFVKDRWRMKKYLRYCDDLAVFHDDPGLLRELRAALVEELGRMRLHLNEGKSRLRRPKEGLTWLGFVVRPDRVRLARQGVVRSRRRVLRRAGGLGSST